MSVPLRETSTIKDISLPSSANRKALPRLFWISSISQGNRVKNFVEMDKGLKARLRL